MQIVTSHLIITALNEEELELYALNESAQSPVNPNGPAQSTRAAILNKLIPAIKQNPDQWLFRTLWNIKWKTDGKVVADFCFKGPPDQSGSVEIGYETYSGARNKGIMTEALGAIIHAIAKTKSIRRIIAFTSPANVASHRVLEKNGFVLKEVMHDEMRWEKDTEVI